MHASHSIEPSQPAADAVGRRRSRVLRPWRWALMVYGIGLTVATHWPRLHLGPEVPASDKMIHLLAFGGLTLLLWRSGFLGPAPPSSPLTLAGGSRRGAVLTAGLVAILWASMDEISQGIPTLGRTMTWHDVLANFCGVACAMALLWAMGPVQPADQLAAPDRARSRLLQFTFDDMFATHRPWIIGMAVALATIVIIFVVRPLLPSARSVGVFGLIAAAVAAHALYLVYRRIFFRRFERVMGDRPCLACGAPMPREAGTCPVCGSLRSNLDFAMPQRPPLSAIVQVSIAPAVTALIGVLALFALVLLVPYLYSWSINTPGGTGRAAAPRFAQLVGRLPRELNSVIDLTVYVLLIALVVRMWRRRMAAYLDRAFRCRRCGHDLHGTPTDEQGNGHCPECGEPFTRERFTTEITGATEAH